MVGLNMSIKSKTSIRELCELYDLLNAALVPAFYDLTKFIV